MSRDRYMTGDVLYASLFCYFVLFNDVNDSFCVTSEEFNTRDVIWQLTSFLVGK